MKKLSLLAVALLCVAAPSFGNSYYACGNGHYSDSPANMQVGRCEVVSVKTGTVIKPADPTANAKPMSLADQQAQINNQIAAQNKKIEEDNAKMFADAKAENCKAAQMNKETVEKTNARNKDQLLPKYEADIEKYCS